MTDLEFKKFECINEVPIFKSAKSHVLVTDGRLFPCGSTVFEFYMPYGVNTMKIACQSCDRVYLLEEFGTPPYRIGTREEESL